MAAIVRQAAEYSHREGTEWTAPERRVIFPRMKTLQFEDKAALLEILEQRQTVLRKCARCGMSQADFSRMTAALQLPLFARSLG